MSRARLTFKHSNERIREMRLEQLLTVFWGTSHICALLLLTPTVVLILGRQHPWSSLQGSPHAPTIPPTEQIRLYPIIWCQGIRNWTVCHKTWVEEPLKSAPTITHFLLQPDHTYFTPFGGQSLSLLTFTPIISRHPHAYSTASPPSPKSSPLFHNTYIYR